MDFKKTQNFILISIIILAVLGSAVFYLRSDADEVRVTASDEEKIQANDEENNDNVSAAQEGNQSETEMNTVFVHVAGQVKNPGVYELRDDLRVIDAVNMAGGPLQDADLDSLNLAEKLHDEEKIYVPKKGEVPPPSNIASGSTTVTIQSGTQSKGKVNINTAGIEELKSLPGIGDVLAGYIIEYRNANGPFIKIEDIVNVPKIGPKTFENIKDKITI